MILFHLEKIYRNNKFEKKKKKKFTLTNVVDY